MSNYQQSGPITDEHKDDISELLSEYTDDPEHITNIIFEILGLEKED